MALLLCCPTWTLHILDWEWSILAALASVVATHGYLIVEAKARAVSLRRAQGFARDGLWAEVLRESSWPRRAEVAAAGAILVVIAVLLKEILVSWPWERYGFDSPRLEWAAFLETRVRRLNACAVLGPLVGAVVAVAWALALARRLQLAGLHRAARLALAAGETGRHGYRSPDPRERAIAAWLLHPGPQARWVAGAALAFVATAVLPLCIGMRAELVAVVETLGCFRGCSAFDGASRECADWTLASGESALTLATCVALAGCAASVFLLVAVLTAPGRARGRHPPSLACRPSKRAWAAPAACALGAACLTGVTAPYERENDDPLPWGPAMVVRSWVSGIELGDQDGPDEPVDAPLVSLEAALLDGLPLSGAADLSEKLAVKRELWRSVQPGKPFPGIVVLSCSASTTAREVIEASRAARDAGFPNISMGIVRRELVVRPLFGELALSWPSAALATVSPDADGEREVVFAADYDSCADLVRAIVDARSRGLVRVDLGEP